MSHNCEENCCGIMASHYHKKYEEEANSGLSEWLEKSKDIGKVYLYENNWNRTELLEINAIDLCLDRLINNDNFSIVMLSSNIKGLRNKFLTSLSRLDRLNIIPDFSNILLVNQSERIVFRNNSIVRLRKYFNLEVSLMGPSCDILMYPKGSIKDNEIKKYLYKIRSTRG